MTQKYNLTSKPINLSLLYIYLYEESQKYKDANEVLSPTLNILLAQGVEFLAQENYEEAASVFNAVMMHSNLSPKFFSKIYYKMYELEHEEYISSVDDEFAKNHENSSLLSLYASYYLDNDNCDTLMSLTALWTFDKMPKELFFKLYGRAIKNCEGSKHKMAEFQMIELLKVFGEDYIPDDKISQSLAKMFRIISLNAMHDAKLDSHNPIKKYDKVVITGLFKSYILDGDNCDTLINLASLLKGEAPFTSIKLFDEALEHCPIQRHSEVLDIRSTIIPQYLTEAYEMLQEVHEDEVISTVDINDDLNFYSAF